MVNDLSKIVQYAGPKRFLASIGLVLVALSILLPWLMINQSVAVDMKAVDYNSLTDWAQYGVKARQIISLALVVSSCFLSPILGFLGITFATIAFWAWFLFGDGEEYSKTSNSNSKKSEETPADLSPALTLFDKPKTQEITPQKSEQLKIKVSAQTFFLQKIIEMISDPNGMGAEYAIHTDNEIIDLILTPKSEERDLLIMSTRVYQTTAMQVLGFYSSSFSKWATYNNNTQKAKVIGVIFSPRPTPFAQFLIFLLNRKTIFFIFKHHIRLFQLDENKLSEKTIADLLKKNLLENRS